MTTDHIETFLKAPRIADLATVRPNGSPHVAPLWFLYEDGVVRIMCDKMSVKMTNIRSDPRVSLSVATDVEPYEYVLVNGVAEESYEGVPELLDRISVHYKGEEEGIAYAKKIVDQIDFCIVTIRPTKITGWTDSSAG